MKTIAIEGSPRADLGTKASKDLRKQGQLPCVVYGGSEVIHFHAPYAAFRHLIYTPEFKKAVITLNGKTIEAIVKEFQQDPLTDTITHIDFLELTHGKAIVANVPLVIKGTAKGVLAGGKLLQKVRRLKVKAKPEQLAESLELSVDELDLGKSMRVRDLNLPEGVQVLNAPSTPLVTVEIPRALRSQQTREGKEGKK